MKKKVPSHFTDRLGRRMIGFASLPLLMLLAGTFAGAPLRAQVDLAGEWSENLHEDFPSAAMSPSATT
jgi:hypothetical protein